jgi:hypothetical protein
MTGDSGPEIGALLGDGTSDGRASHLTLGVDNDTGVILEVQLIAFSSSEALSLTDDNRGQHLLSEFWLTLLDRSEEQFTDGTLGESVQSGADHSDGNDVQVLGTSVVSAVHNAKGGETRRDSQLGSSSSSSSSLCHCFLCYILTLFLFYYIDR